MESHGAEHLGGLLHRVAMALRTEVTAAVLEPLGLTFPEYICMRTLSRGPGRSNAELARDMNVSPQAMNMVVRGLQRARPGHPAGGGVLGPVAARRNSPARNRTARAHQPWCCSRRTHLLEVLGEQDRREFRRMLAALDDYPIVSQ